VKREELEVRLEEKVFFYGYLPLPKCFVPAGDLFGEAGFMAGDRIEVRRAGEVGGV